MEVSASQIFKDLDQGKWKPFYLILGEEPFQATEITDRLKQFFVKQATQDAFNYDAFDGEHLDAGRLLSVLDTLPGLFDEPNASRLVVCTKVDKAPNSAFEILEGYFQNPSPTTCFLMTATKVDRRKSWVKQVEKLGYTVEVSEPYEREWPRWQQYFEKKVGKKIETEAWEILVESCGRVLSVAWSEVQKASLYVGSRSIVTREDLQNLAASGGDNDVFAFAEEVLCRRSFKAMKRYYQLCKNGENEIKLLSILVRQFRMVEQCSQLMAKGITDSKTLSAQIGTHPFFVPKIMGQAKHQTPVTLRRAIDLLADCDYRLKTGAGSLFEHFMVPYFSKTGLSHRSL